MRMAREIAEPANAAAYVKQKRKSREAIMGFGHRVYRAEDPRARHLRDGVRQLSEEKGEPHWNQILEALVDAMPEAKRAHIIHKTTAICRTIYLILFSRYLKYFVRHVEEAVSSATCAHHWHDNRVIPRKLLCLVRGARATCVTRTQ